MSEPPARPAIETPVSGLLATVVPAAYRQGLQEHRFPPTGGHTLEHQYSLFAEDQPWPEGPAVAPDGWILNVCSFSVAGAAWAAKGGDICATNTEAALRTYTLFSTSTRDIQGIPAALAFGPDDCLYVTDEGRRAIVRVAPDGTLADFITSYEGQRLNGPNDLTFDPDGNLYFTDPWGSSADNRIGQVYGYEWASSELHLIDSGMAFPNGIVVRDGRLLVAETYTNMLWAYDITGPGRAGGKREFCRMPEAPDSPVTWQGRPLAGPDGMAFDAAGNLFVAHIGSGNVIIYNEAGHEIGAMPTGGRKPTNVCFGGPGYDELFVTVDDSASLVRYRVGVDGHRLSFCPSLRDAHPWSEMLPKAPSSGLPVGAGGDA